MPKWFDRFLIMLNQRGEEYGFPYVLFSLFMLLNYVLDIPSWLAFQKGQADPFITFQMISFGLAIIFSLRKFWPQYLQKFYALGWYGFVIWCSPFAETFYLIHYAKLYPVFTSMLILNGFCLLFTLILIVDWLSFIIILFIGIAVGLTSQLIIFSVLNVPHNIIESAITGYSWVIFTGILFSRNASRYHANLLLKRKISSLKTMGSLAHELRGPLTTIQICADGMQEALPILLKNYAIAQAADPKAPKLFEGEEEQLGSLLKNINSEATLVKQMIKAVLASSSEMAKSKDTGASSQIISDCVQTALARYSFEPAKMRDLVHLDLANNFTFNGDPVMISHVLFNLLRNALQIIQEAQRGEIYISFSQGQRQNFLHFKDTAKGMSPETQKKIFEGFHTESKGGTGLGLVFCKTAMKGMQGSIEVNSELGQFTEFVLGFPKG